MYTKEKKTTLKIKKQEPKNKIEPISLIKMIIPYSVIKITEKSLPKYSTLKPDTNSDSPSEKSNGVRLDSDKLRKIHINHKNGKKKIKLKPLSHKRSK
jgi:hypothetical protein